MTLKSGSCTLIHTYRTPRHNSASSNIHIFNLSLVSVPIGIYIILQSTLVFKGAFNHLLLSQTKLHYDCLVMKFTLSAVMELVLSFKTLTLRYQCVNGIISFFVIGLYSIELTIIRRVAAI